MTILVIALVILVGVPVLLGLFLPPAGRTPKKREGLVKTYYNDGSRKCEKNYKNGKLNGLYREWHPNSQLKVEINVFNNIIKTPFNIYFDDGQLEEECPRSFWYDDTPFSDDTKLCKITYSGETKEWFKNGNLKCEGFHIKGEEDGYWRWYYINGKLEKEGSLKDGHINGQWKYYHENGKLKKEGKYERPILVNDKVYTYGVSGVWKHYHKNGKLHFSRNYHPPKTMKLIGGWKLTKNSKKLVPLKGETEEITIETWKDTDGKLLSINEIIKYLDKNLFYSAVAGAQTNFGSPDLKIINDFLIARSQSMRSHWGFNGVFNGVKYEYGVKVASASGSKNSKDKKSTLLEYKKAIEQMLKNLHPYEQWMNIIKMRADGQAQMVKQGIAKMDDYNYWANGHLEEYMLKYENNEETSFYPDGVELRIKVFSEIIQELEKVIKKAAELKLNITTEMHNDYCAARGSLLGIQMAKIEIEKRKQK